MCEGSGLRLLGHILEGEQGQDRRCIDTHEYALWIGWGGVEDGVLKAEATKR